MASQMYLDVATVVTKLQMYPYFDAAHYVLMCMAVREDILSQQSAPPATSSESGRQFSRRHPLSSWVSSMLMCFAGSLIANFLLGEPVITPLKDHRNIATATAVWYLVNYSPFDLVYKLGKFLPFHVIICIMKETHRAHTIYHGVLVAKKLYPNAYLIIVLVGTIKGAGSGLIRNFDRLVRGIWLPNNNEILQPTFVTKASLFASVIFLCERLQLIGVPHPLIYFGIVIFFIYFKISSVILGVHDPFLPLENLFCALFMGGLADALQQARNIEQTRGEESKKTDSDSSSQETKKQK